ncbi:MAG TPA: aminotransferase class III-fold pyridoxal phosphate-dependent enzyme, partial [Propionibacteriaceae bacterium]
GEKRRWAAEPGSPGAVRILDPYTYRCPAGHPDPCPVCTGAPHVEEILRYENPASVAAIVLESVTGTNGVIVPPDGYLASIRQLCDKYGILLILDEVMVGFGRTGKWFASEHWDVVPDIMVVAKGINSGYVPLGAMIASEKFRPWLRENTFTSGMTYSGHPLACAVAVESIAVMKEYNVVEQAADNGAYLGSMLTQLQDRHPSIGEVRGLGMFWGLEIVRNRETREPLVPLNGSAADNAPMSKVVAEALRLGLYISGHQNIVRLAPPLTITRQEITQGVEILDQALMLADSYMTE